MKILKPSPDHEWHLVVECRHCKAELEIEGSDVKFDPGSDYPIYHKICFYVDCPECKHTPEIPERDIPQIVQDEARERTRRLSKP